MPVKPLVKIQKELSKGVSLSEAAESVGWSRQRAHRYFAEGTLVNPLTATPVYANTKVDHPCVKNMFGTYIYDVLRHGGRGATMQAACKQMPDIILSVGHAYNAPISRLAYFFLDKCLVRKSDRKFLRLCSDLHVGVRDKIAVARYIHYKDYD